MNPENSVAIVTGGGQGIGKAVALRLLKDGMKVVIAEIDAEAGEETARELKELGDVRFIQCDVASETSVKNMIQKSVEYFGGIRALVNNAAVAANKPLEELSFEEWSRVIGVNLSGAFLCSKYAAPHLRESGGLVINLASTRAFMSEANTEAYSASKGGIFALTHALAVSLGPQIRVNCISPGWIETSEWQKTSRREKAQLRPEDHGQHPADRVGRPEDIASAVAFLISEENSFITGANFIIDGGMTRKMIYV